MCDSLDPTVIPQSTLTGFLSLQETSSGGSSKALRPYEGNQNTL